MAKLFPPVIEGIVPAFYDNSKGEISITLPFTMNRAVSQSQVKGLAIKIKTVQSSNYLYTGTTEDIFNFELEDSCWVRFNISKEDVPQMKIGSSYKFQIAYIDKTDTIGYYSTVGVGKYTAKPNLSINSLVAGQINSHQYHYTGFYSQKDKDPTESVYSYRFDVYDSDNNIIATSGDQLHNSVNDTEIYESYDEYFLARDLPLDKAFFIVYTVNTINGMTISTPKYKIMQKLSIDPEIKATLSAAHNYENGYITISLVGEKNNDGMEEPATGAFLLTRACEDSNYTEWDEISRFKLAAQVPSRALWTDYTTEQGKNYKYSLQQYNDKGLYSNRIYSNIVYSDFEDAFLYDGKRQLKIKYNPKVASFKKDLLETKIDTIGSKHPFILRNGRVDYKEFSLSGLISYFMDEEGQFLAPEEYNFKEKTINLVGENIAQERDFKMKVYEWLTNGEPKLFRSPSEGNYIVRLMNVSMTPNDVLGRMLHTFTATAYEVAEYNYSNLSSFGFIKLTDPEVAQLRFDSVNLGEFTVTIGENGERKVNYTYANGALINKHPVYTIRFTDMNPGDRVQLWIHGRDEPEIIQIGITGSYYVDLGVAIDAIRLDDGVIPAGNVVYSYYSIQSNVFDKIDNVSINEVPVRQFIGEHDILKEIEYIKNSQGEWVKNPKVDLIKFFNLSAQKRSIEKIVAQLTPDYKVIYFKDKDKKEPLGDDKDIFTLYACGDWVPKKTPTDDASYLPYDRFNWDFVVDHYVDFANNDERIKEYQPFIMFNGSQVSVEDTRDFFMDNPGKPKSLICGNGCTLEVAYQIRIIDYSIEEDNTYKVKGYKEQYLSALESLNSYLKAEDEVADIETFNTEVEQLRSIVDSTYRSYVLALIDAQKEEKEAEGLL